MPIKTFLSSQEWLDFRKDLGDKVFIKNETQAVKIKSRWGSFLLSVHSNKLDLDWLKQIARQEKCLFIRIAPLKEVEEGIVSPVEIFPERTWVLDLSLSVDELLAGMKRTARQRSKSKEIKIKRGTLKEFYPIYEATAQRQGFGKFCFNYIEKELKYFDNIILLAYKKKEILAGAVIFFWNKTAYYRHGASKPKSSPAANVLQWSAIQEAKRRGCWRYDFWVIAPHDGQHKWAGLTSFKKSFGGRSISFPKTKDIPMSWKYYLIYLYEKAKKKL
jgi:lipid II:glycine glycyltransferase (peptidoglycan interpeptide bridge formation enzyme)